MTNLSLYLLGPVRVKLNEADIEVKPRKALALLIYLAVTAERQARDSLATLLWPESSQRLSRQAVRGRLSELNQALGSDWIEADRERIGLRPGFWLDVAEFEQIQALESNDPQSLIAAVDLYRDDFLSGFTLPDCPDFDEWQYFQSESLRQSLASALERLAALLNSQGNPETAISYARRWLALDPLHEAAHRQLMQLYARAGQQAAALRQYEICRQTLEDELGISPAPETTSLFDNIRTGRLSPITPAPLTARSHHNLPTQTTSFIGREDELADIKRLLLKARNCRLLNLLGPGGTGKTRLALAAANHMLDAFPDGVYFVSLAPVSEETDIVPAIADALRFTFYGQDDPKDQLLNYLGQQQLLLIVDNFEHLLDGAALLSDILGQAPNVTLLTTSRERLNLQEEWVYEVGGLAFPTATEATSKGLSSYSALELFAQRARQTVSNFAPSEDEMTDIGRICQLVEGMPLGIELAAPWIRTLSCAEIAAEIEGSFDFLSTTLRNLPERHRSLRVVFEQTWGRLSEAERAVLMQLSVFRGGCTREAAEQVTGATLPLLTSLVDKALLRRVNTGRYELHELIRQFAETRLQTNPQAAEQAQQQHHEYFVAFLKTRTAGVRGKRQLETVNEIRADMDNVRLVWRRAVANRDAEAIERVAECLYVYYLYNSGHYEGRVAFQQAINAFTENADVIFERNGQDEAQPELVVLDQQEALVGFLLAGQSHYLTHTLDPRVGQCFGEEALALLRRVKPVDRRKEAFALAFLSWTLVYQDRLDEASPYAELGLTLAAETGDHLSEYWSLLAFGSPGAQDRPAEAEPLLKRAMALCQKRGDLVACGYIYHNMCTMATQLGRYVEAQYYVDQAFRISEQFNNRLGMAYAFSNQGRLAICRGEYPQAIEALQESASSFNEVKSIGHASRMGKELGLAFHRQGDYRQAEKHYRLLLDYATAVNNQHHIAYGLLGLGCLAQDEGDLHQAEQLQREALVICQQMGREGQSADAFRCLGHLMVISGEARHDEARQHFRQTLELAAKQQMAPLALDVCLGVARLLAHTDQIAHAVELAALAEQHEASTFETKEKARQLLAELGDQLSPETVEAARAGGQNLDWQRTATRLMANLA